MAKRNKTDHIVLEVPEAYEMSETPPAISAVGRRSVRKNDILPDDSLLTALIEEHDFVVDKTFYLKRERDYRKRSAGAAPEDTKMKIAVPALPEEQVVILLEEDGVYRWVFEPPQERKRNVQGAEGAENREFEIELSGYVHQPTRQRGISEKVKSFAKKVKGHIIKIRESTDVSSLTIKRLERNVNQGLLDLRIPGGAEDPELWTPLQSLDAVEMPANRSAKVLLFVHGTFSSTVGSYGGLCEITEGRSFLKKAAEAYDFILGFDHYTLSETPAENAWELLKMLKTAPWPKSHPPIIDAIAYSRGGLVLRSLIEKELPDDAWRARVRRAIFVGATNAGTELARPENWHRFIDFYTNLAASSARVVSLISGAGLAGPVWGGMIRGLGAFAKYMASASVTDAKIPGLSAMEPDGPFVNDLNQVQKGQPGAEDIDYFAVTSDFDIGMLENGESPGLPKRLLLSMGENIVDELMGDASNDLVVNTTSMTSIDPGVEGLIKQVRAYGTNGQVYHTVYFLQPETARALYEWLEMPGEIATATVHERTARRTVWITDEEPVKYTTLSIAAEDSVRARDRAAIRRISDRPRLKVAVHWDDITKAEGDVYAVGHYRGVDPQSAELAVDHQLSGVDWSMPWEERRKKLVLTRLTKQGLLIGDIGQIDLLPWGDESQKMAAICGMGFYNGDFSEQNLQLLYRKLVWKLNMLPCVKTLCTVLIGSGVGALDTRRALRGQLNGYADALAAFSDPDRRIQEVRIVEYDKLKAQEIHDALLTICRQDEIDLDLIVDEEVLSKGTGQVSEEHTLSLVVGSMLKAFQLEAGNKRKEMLESFLENSGIKSIKTDEIMPRLSKAWARLQSAAMEMARNIEMTGQEGPISEQALESRINKTASSLLTEQGLTRTISVKLFAGGDMKDDIPSRLSIRLQDDVYRIAGLTASSAVPEREIKVDVKLVQELIERMTDPDADMAHRHGKILYQLLIPGEFEGLLTSSGSIVIEVDRNTAPIHWEMLVSPNWELTGAIALTLPISRQLRTTYSNMPSSRLDNEKLALVIGDPDGTLDFAREEAIMVSDVLKRHGYEVDAFIGSPDEVTSQVEGYPPANRLDVLGKLFEGKYAIVHYAGHGDYDRRDPSNTGWKFNSGLLTAGEIQRLKDAPVLIFANACLSGRTSLATGVAKGDAVEASRLLGKPYGEAGLLASLADEVLKIGVRNYIGTAWEVDDKGAILFAERFYEHFLGGTPIGESVYKARKRLSRHPQYGALWAAYQHYGPPDFIL